MKIESQIEYENQCVLIQVSSSFGKTEDSVCSQPEAETMIAQFRDAMEDFYRVWPYLRDEMESWE